MSTYCIGDLQGCYATLQALLERIGYQSGKDQLIFVGDLVNRGSGSLQCLRWVSGAGDGVSTVLGNHDLHLLAVAEGFKKSGPLDTLQPVLQAPDVAELLAWLRRQPLLRLEEHYAVVHAGLLPAWGWDEALGLAGEVSTALQGPQYRDLLSHMYGNEPDAWSEDLRGFKRLRFIINVMTRMRTLDAKGRLDMRHNGGLESMPQGLRPWFDVPAARQGRAIVAGHWSALGFYRAPGFIGLDSGCVWGRSLTALRLKDGEVFQVPAEAADLPDAREE